MHTPDVNVIRPVFVGGDGWSRWTGTTAHHVDVGGVRTPAPRARTSRRCTPRAWCCRRCGCTGAARRTRRLAIVGIAANVRDPVSTLSDLRAQRGGVPGGRATRRSNSRAVRCTRRCPDAMFGQMLDAAERARELALATLPDGEAEAEGFLDDDGAGGPPTRIHVRLAKTADALTVRPNRLRAAGRRRV